MMSKVLKCGVDFVSLFCVLSAATPSFVPPKHFFHSVHDAVKAVVLGDVTMGRLVLVAAQLSQLQTPDSAKAEAEGGDAGIEKTAT